MKKFLFITVLVLIVCHVSAQLNIAKKAIKNIDLPAKEVVNKVTTPEETNPTPFYSPEQKAEIISQIRSAKKLEELPVITTIAYYPIIEVTKLVTVLNGITDEQETMWNNEEKLKIGDTIRVYGTYNLGQYDSEHKPAITDLSPVPYKNRLALITPTFDEKSRFVSSRAVEKCLDYWGDTEIWYTYEGRKDTILLREQYLKEKEATK